MNLRVILCFLSLFASAFAASGAEQHFVVRLKGHVRPQHHFNVMAKKFTSADFRIKGAEYVYDSLGPEFRGYAVHLSSAAADALRGHPEVLSVTEDIELDPWYGVVPEDKDDNAERRTSSIPRHQPGAQHRVRTRGGSDICFRQRHAGWNLNRIDEASPANLTGNFIYSDAAGTGINLYVVDNGIYPHNDIKGRWTCELDTWSSSGKCRDTTTSGHGTHTACIAAGTTYGVAKNATLKIVKARTGAGAIAGLNFVVRQCGNPNTRHCMVTMSLGVEKIYPDWNDAANAVVRAGIPMFASAGNGGRDAALHSVGGASKAVAVGATGLETDDDDVQYDERSKFSNFGPAVSLFAPGANIASCGITGPDSERIKSGTSMATPLAAGAAALLWSQPENWDLSGDQLVKLLLEKTTSDIVLLACDGDQNTPTCKKSTNKFLFKNCV